ncbi:hypothetical protein H0H10_20390 [Streptomyces sp. TRM S81-3]|uniref:FtsH ternary system domain-containing protein n=1 Tax=Streptomyces griseicoloratus TaxID=2752516 RepID=A0A926L4J3_9ACTN|nr:hypothetical protein [Streptomyces griseicoloratus]MBD0421486.1 hypothetical protein [Streptomyces griseicoloratus]
MRTLHWAITEPDDSLPPPPSVRDRAAGPATGDPVVLLERLARVTAARLRLSDPPLGDDGPAGLEALLLAAALAVRDDAAAAEQVVGGVREPRTVRDLMARHGLVGRALPALAPQDALRAGLLRASPLTALLDHPPPGGEGRCGQLLDRFLDHPEGRRTVVAALAVPPATPETARYRAALLRRFRFTPGERTVVYEVYETALLHHARRYRELTDAVRDLVRDGPARLLADDPPGRWARATLDWWEPLAVIARRHPQELRRRRMLRGHGTGVALHRLYGGVRDWEGLREVLDR